MMEQVNDGAPDAARQWMADELNRLEQETALRTLKVTEALVGGRVLLQERAGGAPANMLNLASNDYLGLALEPVEAVGDSALPFGAGASRLVTGNHPIYEQFEAEFGVFKGTESALLLNSGYSANVALLTALCGRGDAVFGDRLNHASIVDGMVLSRADLHRYRHRDMNELEHLLKQTPPGKKKLIVSDAVFSMDGTVAPLADLVTLKERYGALLLIDEAHSGGVFGDQGQGLTHALGLATRVDLQMGTFSKAYGRFGAYVVCDDMLKRYLVNKARPFIYTTALPPALVGAVRENWLRVKREGWRRTHLHQLASRFRERLLGLDYDIGGSESHIVPLIVGSNEHAVRLQQFLAEHSLLAVAIRPPTVPRGTARIRFSWTAAHQPEDVDRVVSVIEQAFAEGDNE